MNDPQIIQHQKRSHDLLSALLHEGNDVLHQSLRYSVLGGGKRLRPLLVYAASEVVSGDKIKADNAAVAVELIHAYSLIHDDLPAMDNATLRHSQLTCHLKFNEATAILAGDALQSLAFEVLAKNANIKQINILAAMIGASGVALGQSLDLQAQDHLVSLEQLQKIHQLKTGALITASVQLGAFCGEVNDTLFANLTRFSHALGLAYQIQDDILDVKSDQAKLGKTKGSDVVQHKSTYVTLLGLEAAEKELQKTYEQVKNILQKIPDSQFLSKLSRFIIERDY